VHLWADRFDGSLEDVFELQDQMTTSVVGAVAPKVNQAEIDRMKCKTTGSLDAYDYYLRGVEGLNQRTRESVDNALRFFHKALEIDPGFAAAFGAAARCYTLRQASGWMKDRAQEIEETSRLAHKAVEFGKDDALALSNAGVALAYVVHDFDAGTLFVDRALTLNSNLASAWYSSGWLRTWLGEPELAISHFARSLRMSPLDPLVPMIHAGISLAHTFSGNFEEAVFHAETALSERPQLHQGLRAAAVSNALVGRTERARKVMASLRQLDPSLRISNLSDLTPLCRQGDFARYAEGMRLAGLPE
jgi:adenylate cyclase